MRSAVVVGTGFGLCHPRSGANDRGFEIAALVGRNPTKLRTRAGTLRRCEPHDLCVPMRSHCRTWSSSLSRLHHTLMQRSFSTATAAGSTCVREAFTETAKRRRYCNGPLRQRSHQPARVPNCAGPPHRRLHRAILDGAIGEPRLERTCCTCPLLAAADTRCLLGGRCCQEVAGSVLASHVIDQVRITLGEFAESVLRCRGCQPRLDREDSYSSGSG